MSSPMPLGWASSASRKVCNVGKAPSMANKIVAVLGAAGQQGGAVARHLLDSGWAVRALTRDPAKSAARALAAAGAEVVRADNDDRASLAAAFRGAHGVFSVQNYWLPNVGKE